MISLKGDRAVRFSNTIIHRIQAWWHSRSNRFAALVALFAFVSYGAGHQAWLSFGLWAACIFVALALPTYSRFSNKIDERFCRLTAWVTAGRLARFVLQFAFNLAMLGAMAWGGALDPAKVAVVGGVVALAALTTAASQGAQYVGLLLARYGVGEPMTNVQIGLSANIIATALASFGLAAVAEAYTVLALILGALGFGSGLLSDLRGLFAPRGGIGLFFGTFNPVHKTHLALIERAIAERGLSKVIVHPTLLTAGHRRAMEQGEIRIARVEKGYEVFEKTPLADPNVDYFPTGDRFLPPAVRRDLIMGAVQELGLADKVEVWFLPDVYATRGFLGVYREARRRFRGERLHVIHGSDWGGMQVRAIADDSGWHYPFAVRRSDQVSATAIRRGAKGLAPASVEAALERLASVNHPGPVAGTSSQQETAHSNLDSQKVHAHA
jgi:hypothetical protein